MDLLEALDDFSTQRKTFKKNIEIDLPLSEDAHSDAETQQIQDGADIGFNLLDGILGFGEDSTQISLTDKPQGGDQTLPSYGDADDLITKVRRRLNGETEAEAEAETQKVDTNDNNGAKTQKTPFGEDNTQLVPSKTQNIEFGEDTQLVSSKTQNVQYTEATQLIPSKTQADKYLSPEAEDLSEINDADDVRVQPTGHTRLFIMDSDSEAESDEALKTKRALKIAERAAAKKALRDHLEQERARTAAEADEYDEAENSKIVSSDVSMISNKKSRSKQEDKILAETRRLQRAVEFVPVRAKNKKFDKNKLFAAFGYNQTSSPEKGSPAEDNMSTPTTSPITTPLRQQQQQKQSKFSPGLRSDDEDDDFETSNVLDLLDSDKMAERAKALEEQKKRRALNNPLKSYEERLNDNAIDKKGAKVIELDSDPEADSIDALKHHTSKETRLDIKTKFVRKKKQQQGSASLTMINLNRYFPQLPTKKLARNFIGSLNSTATRQLREIILAKNANKTESDKQQSANKEGLSIEDLLEREIERNLRIKRKENRGSRKESQDSEADDESVQEMESSDNEDDMELDSSEEESQDGEEQAAELQVKSSFVEPQSQASQHAGVEPHQEVHDVEEEEEEEDAVFAKPLVKNNKRKTTRVLSDEEEEDSIRSSQNNNSFMYGAEINDDADGSNTSEFQLGSYGSQPSLKKMLGVSMTQAFESTLPAQDSKSTANVMANLRTRHLNMIGELEEDESFEDHPATKDSFMMNDDTTFVHINNKNDETGNEETTIGQSLQNNQRQPVEDSIGTSTIPLQTQDMMVGTQADYEHDLKTQRKRKLIRKVVLAESESEAEAQSDSESDEETRKINLAIAKEKQRQREIRRKRKLKEWKRKGVTNIVDDEATESEDEYKGLGGADGDFSDVENSEDEKMLDDASKVDLKANELRSKFAQEEKKRNEDDVRKLLEDIKTGRLRKRRHNGDSLDIELSDDEEDLKNYYMSRVNNQRNRLLQNDKIASIASNEKSKAFFETIAEKPVAFKLERSSDIEDSGIEIIEEDEEEEDDHPKDKENDNPFVDNKDQQQPQKKKRRVKLTREYITRTISEVCDIKGDEQDGDATKLFAKYQHGFTDDVEDELDLIALKKQSSVLMTASSRSSQAILEEPRTQNVDAGNDEDDEEEFNPVKRSSLVKSFQRFNSSSSMSTVREVEVTVSKAYKNSIGNKASIGYLANKSSTSALLKGRTLKARTIENTLKHDRSKSELKGVFKSGNFN